jgi:hypothetical protein
MKGKPANTKLTHNEQIKGSLVIYHSSTSIYAHCSVIKDLYQVNLGFQNIFKNRIKYIN